MRREPRSGGQPIYPSFQFQQNSSNSNLLPGFWMHPGRGGAVAQRHDRGDAALGGGGFPSLPAIHGGGASHESHR